VLSFRSLTRAVVAARMPQDSEANLQGSDSCFYDQPPAPCPGCIPAACSATNSYACTTQPACAAAGLQWVPCATLAGDDCQPGDTPGQCTALCTSDYTAHCYSEADCNSANTAANPVQWTPGSSTVTTHSPGRCERACSDTSYYTCRTELACTAAGMQWTVQSGGTSACTRPVRPHSTSSRHDEAHRMACTCAVPLTPAVLQCVASLFSVQRTTCTAARQVRRVSQRAGGCLWGVSLQPPSGCNPPAAVTAARLPSQAVILAAAR
jgi:hypothetical protein